MSTEAESRFEALTSVQAKVALFLARGYTITEAAEACDIHRVTIYRWCKSNPNFQKAVRHGQSEYILALRDDLRDLSKEAIDTLRQTIRNPAASLAVRSRVAMFILTRPRFPKPGCWNLPVPDPESEEIELQLEDNPLIAEDYQRLRKQNQTPDSPAAPAATGCNTMQPDSGTSAAAHKTEPVNTSATGCNAMQQNRGISAASEPPKIGGPIALNRIQLNATRFPKFGRRLNLRPVNALATRCNTMQPNSKNPAAPGPPKTASVKAAATGCNAMQPNSTIQNQQRPSTG
jgi:transposase-like protein